MPILLLLFLTTHKLDGILIIPTVGILINCEVIVIARNKFPEETVQKILNVAYELFSKKGYEQTSIQDIVENLGMSKGAIYHHFKSKEEILNQICENNYNCMDWFTALLEDKNHNALEKLRQVFSFQLGDTEKRKVDKMAAAMFRNPKVVYDELHASVNQIAPMLTELIEEGNRDGSLHVEHPLEAAQVMMLLANFWINPILFPVDKKLFLEKINFYKGITESMGIPVMNEELTAVCSDYYDVICSMQA